ncbi:[FeFe] hydrogenase H-cluster maturation GTPase HydF [Blautia glucerasea]|uniref:[FeFe] hydrogenase H-cluster maturation GTPase HydF n=1 Tax=Blautia glucerasea TaxID=536633 RepID=UPI001D0127F0|nr:[FeFe] hydrogenase H-cluster maturation GTPase HydF [Blautia glucerasea]MCB5388692.1 [FeFe] hydrogenase H-cluster maturation GTPase HydF [Blautia glucerasea]MCB5423027.1 [FeFe] hydrogenase H-cluster maturation GTPase HydF [Blautia luti]
MSSLNQTPSANRLHISFFGCRNAGKSSVVNAVTGQELSIVSDIKGTTTDPVTKAMELLPLGPVVIIDTPGIDDVGQLGELRVLRTKKILNKTDLAVLVVDGIVGMQTADQELVELFQKKEIPYLVVYNKADLIQNVPTAGENEIWVSATEGTNIYELKERLGALVKTDTMTRKLVGQLLKPLDMVILVCPIDESAPKGRLILPQQQAIRDVLEAGAIAVVIREHELAATLEQLGGKAAMVITDSQAFALVGKVTPDSIPLTSFSILMANYKGFLKTAVNGISALENLKDGDKVLIAEGCTHHRQCNDIGTVKLPNWLRAYSGKKLEFEFCSGRDFPEDVSPYALVVHCGGCMLTEREVQYRMRCTVDQGIPFTNYGTVIAMVTGTLERSLRIFPEIHDTL